MKRVPYIDLSRCTECQGCVELAPEVFRYNDDTGMMEILEMLQYPVAKVEEAIRDCPEDCISWEEAAE